MFKRICVILALCLHTLTWGGVASKERNLLHSFMQASFKLSASSSTRVFDALRKFSPIKYQQGGVGQEQNIEPMPPNITYEIGDIAQGGVVIWVTDDKKHGLVVSIINLGPTQGREAYTLAWGSQVIRTEATNNKPLPRVYTKPIPEENYSGYENQQIIEGIPNWQSSYPAFAACKNYSITIGDKTYNDWFLPSIKELQQIWDQREIVNEKVKNIQGGRELFLSTGDPGRSVYWSSSELEGSSDSAWDLYFLTGFQFNPFLNKGRPYAVRCVRAF